MKIVNVVGTRPNFMKIAPIIRAMNNDERIEHILVHTGQHYDAKMSNTFFDELKIPTPDVYLEVGSDSHARQTAKIMMAFEKVCEDFMPDYILVVGDVNSTMACSLVASKMNIGVIHVEAGIRSGDRDMPEEINRLVTDALADYLLPPSSDAVHNLKSEGHHHEKIEMVGNIMIDTLKYAEEDIQSSKILSELGVKPNEYVTLTMHRPSNTDTEIVLREVFEAIDYVQEKIPVVFPMHPRTKKMINQFGLQDMINKMSNLITTEPLGYFDFGKLTSKSKFVITDSGGIQEETTIYGIPCITIRKNTERPITISKGTNKIVGNNKYAIIECADQILQGQWKKGEIPKYWDGKTAERILQFIQEKLI